MRELILMRHAKSSWADPDRADKDRPLNPRGLRTAPRMGAWLHQEQLLPDRILCSTARRAVQTVELILEAIDQLAGHKVPVDYRDDLYMATPWSMVQETLSTPADIQRLLLIGHNPGMEELVEELTGEWVRMPTAAIARLQTPIRNWRDLEGRSDLALTQLITPKDLPEAGRQPSAVSA